MNNTVIEVQNLTKRYKNAGLAAVDNISFSVREGEFFAFLGANGAGKTTTISILTTTLSKTEGNVKIAGFDLDREAQKIRANIGIIFQKPSLDLDLSAEENLRLHACMYGLYPHRSFFMWMPKTYREQVLELAVILGIEDKLWKPLKTFSGDINAVATIVHRDIILMFKSPARLLMALLWPAMMLGMFGSQLSQNMGVFMNFDFNTFMLIGMLVNGLFMITMMGVNSLVEDRENDFTQEILVAPISRLE